jgi:phage gp46-like protein
VINEPPRAPRSILESISPEIERICLKALRKEPSERYATAEAMANDLLAWLEQSSRAQSVSASADSNRRRVIPGDVSAASELSVSSDEKFRFKESQPHRLRKRDRTSSTILVSVSAMILLVIVVFLVVLAQSPFQPSAVNSDVRLASKTQAPSPDPTERLSEAKPGHKVLEYSPAEMTAALEKLDVETFEAEDLDRFLEFVETSVSTDLPNYEQVWFQAEVLAGATYRVKTQDSRPFPPMLALLTGDEAYFVFPERSSATARQIADNMPGREVLYLEVPAAEPDQQPTTRNVVCLFKFYFDARTNPPSSLPREVSIQRLDPVSEDLP